MFLEEELEDTFCLKNCLPFSRKANVKLHNEKGLVLEFSKNSLCLTKKKPLVISFQYFLAVETHISTSEQNESMPFLDLDIRLLGNHSKNTSKVFDKSLEVKYNKVPRLLSINSAST